MFSREIFIYFYGAEAGFRTHISHIDTKLCPIYLLVGEYDYSCTPEDTKRTAAQIAGAEVIIMKEMGHFPMSENPRLFRSYLLPVLEKIHGQK